MGDSIAGFRELGLTGGEHSEGGTPLLVFIIRSLAFVSDSHQQHDFRAAAVRDTRHSSMTTVMEEPWLHVVGVGRLER
jgi:hypothetical protein